MIYGNQRNKKYSNYKAYKLVIIKNLIYNNSDNKLFKKLNNMELNEKSKVSSNEDEKWWINNNLILFNESYFYNIFVYLI